MELTKIQTEIEDAKYAQKKAALSASAWRDEQIATIPTIMSHLNKSIGIQLLFPVIGVGVEAALIGQANALMGQMGTLLVINGFRITPESIFLAIGWLPISYVIFGIVTIADRFNTQSHKGRIDDQHRAMLGDASADANRTIERSQTRGQLLASAHARAEEALAMLEDI